MGTLHHGETNFLNARMNGWMVIPITSYELWKVSHTMKKLDMLQIGIEISSSRSSIHIKDNHHKLFNPTMW